MFRKALLLPCGLVAGASYLSATLDTSFANDRPLHTIAVVLLLSGLAIVLHRVVAAIRAHSSPLEHRYAPIPLGNGKSNGHGLPKLRDASPARKDLIQTPSPLGAKALAGLSVLLLVALCARVAIYHKIVKNIECAGLTLLPFLPLVLALFHALHGSNTWPRRAAALPLCESAFHFATHHRTRYILPWLLLSVSSYRVTVSTITYPSTFICPRVHAIASTVHWLQFLSFLLDCTAVLVLYCLLDDRESPSDSTPHAVRDGARNTTIIGVVFVASALELAVTGGIAYAAFPEHRQWLLSASPAYFTSLAVLSFVLPSTVMCFLYTKQRYGTMRTTNILALSVTYTQMFKAFRIGTSHAFPPKPIAGLVISLVLLTTALIIHVMVDTTNAGYTRPKVPIRLGRSQLILTVLIVFTLLVATLSYPSVYQRSISDHPITTLIGRANQTHEQWAAQAHGSGSLSEAVRHYQERYFRDPPPGFDKWYEFATNRSSIIIDDFDNIEMDLAPFLSLSPEELRRRTIQVLAHDNDLGGISIRNGHAEVFANVPGTHRWMMDGAVQMIEKFSEFLPDMDLAMNLNDECRVAVPFAKLREALATRELYPDPKVSRNTTDFSSKRFLTWPKYWELSRDTTSVFRGVGFNPTFHSFGSIACPPGSPARRQHYGSLHNLCTSCAAPHSMGIFVSNWSMSASPCHQPDLANLHGLHLSPAAFIGTHHLIPIFSQSRAPGYADIRYPSPWNYLDKAVYDVDDQFPDPPFAEKDKTLFWRGATSEGVSAGAGAWKGMMRQRLVHLLNNETRSQPILLARGRGNTKLNYVIENPESIKRSLATKLDVQFVGNIIRCGGPDCPDQTLEFGFEDSVDFKQHWRYKYLFDTDGAGFSGRFIPFLQSQSLVFKAALFREWHEGRLTAWKHFIPVDLRLHDLLSSLAYFGGYGVKGEVRSLEAREKEAEAIAIDGRTWAGKVLRKEDMEVYFFRLLLEWGRLTDEKRKEVGFRMRDGLREEDGLRQRTPE